MQEILNLYGKGFNYLLSHGFATQPPTPSAYEEMHDEEVKRRACQLIKEKKLDAWEVTLYNRGEGPFEDVWKAALMQAEDDWNREILERHDAYVL